MTQDLYDPAYAAQRDSSDPLARFRDEFSFPEGVRVYFCGNSLGLQPKAAADAVRQELTHWSTRAVDGHFDGDKPWYSYHELVRERLAHVVGGLPKEVVAMNSLTVNLHLLMVSFYRPSKARRKILIEAPAFPSDIYAVKSQLAFHGCDPNTDLVVVEPEQAGGTLQEARILDQIRRAGDSLALVMLGGVNFFTGQFFDLRAITQAAHEVGAVAGFDLAHAAGNVPLRLHDWDVDFAAWCSYKYLNAGPGAIGGAFVHERHLADASLPRFAGWWGTDPKTRFRMHLEQEFVPVQAADAWQLSNPPILALAPLDASLEIFEQATMEAIREKSVELTRYLEQLIGMLDGAVEVLTPSDPARRGAQLSLRVHGDARALFERLKESGVVCDIRPPDAIRIAPAPLYTRFEDVRQFASILKEVLR